MMKARGKQSAEANINAPWVVLKPHRTLGRTRNFLEACGLDGSLVIPLDQTPNL